MHTSFALLQTKHHNSLCDETVWSTINVPIANPDQSNNGYQTGKQNIKQCAFDII